AKGDTGATGADGKNAKADVKDNGNGTHTVTINDGEGKTTTTIVKDGAKGDTGADGKNAKAEVKDNGNGTHTVTITDGEGNTTTTIVKDGTAAAKGDTGDNGKSAEAEVTRDDAKGETTITVRNLDKDGKVIGTTSEVVKDGKNAEAKVETTAKGEHTVTIKDGNGNTTTTIIRDGKDGKDGKDADGTFGLRDEDNAEITKKLNNTIQIKGDKGTVQVFDKATGKTSEKEVQNIFVKEDGGALKVSLNRDLHVDSVTSNSVTTNELNVG
ncbi:collagen-flanked surface repeat-containing protein, partial [Neisseria sp. P0021.S004]|uniref:collagen-flanked surface repeat-containing protein n=1 Tax=Neisseria sp. P0021.S004 TaxID=3436819 RepID=UPI003F7FE1BE